MAASYVLINYLRSEKQKTACASLRYSEDKMDACMDGTILFAISRTQKFSCMEQTKSKTVRAVPEGFQSVTPYLIVENAARLIDFIKNAFDGKVTFITHGENKRIMHATVSIGSSTIMISDTMEDMKPQTAMLYLYLEDADGVYKKAIDAKASSVQEPRTEFYGDRAGAVRDAWGNIWWIATHVEDVDPKELERRSRDELQRRRDEVPEADLLRRSLQGA